MGQHAKEIKFHKGQIHKIDIFVGTALINHRDQTSHFSITYILELNLLAHWQQNTVIIPSQTFMTMIYGHVLSGQPSWNLVLLLVLVHFLDFTVTMPHLRSSAAIRPRPTSSANKWKYAMMFKNVYENKKLNKVDLVELCCRVTHCVKLKCM